MSPWILLVMKFTFTLTATLYSQTSGLETTGSVTLTPIWDVRNTTSEGTTPDQNHTIKANFDTDVLSPVVPRNDSMNTDLTSSKQHINESYLTSLKLNTSTTTTGPLLQDGTVVGLKGLPHGKQVWRDFQCDFVAYKCSLPGFSAGNSTKTILMNSTDEDIYGTSLRTDIHKCHETILMKNIHVSVLTESNRLYVNRNITLNFLDSCPPGYPHQNISDYCENPWNHYKNQTNSDLYLPVVSGKNRPVTIASNVYCGICNGFQGIDPINVTLLCGESIFDSDTPTVVLKKCRAFISLMAEQSLIRFQYNLGTGIFQDQQEEAEPVSLTRVATPSILGNTTTRYSMESNWAKINQIKNCLFIENTGFGGNTLDESNVRNIVEEGVHTIVEFYTNNKAEKDSNKLECYEPPTLPFKVSVCFRTRSSFANIRQVFVLSFEETERAKMAACVSALTEHLSTFAADISSLDIKHLDGNSTSIIINVLMTYKKRVFPTDILQSVDKLNFNFTDNCGLTFSSRISRCLPGDAVDEELLWTESFAGKYPNTANIGLPQTDPCGPITQLTSTRKSNSSQKIPECRSYVQLSPDDLRELNRSTTLHKEELHVKIINGEVWICSHYLDQINKPLSDQADDLTDGAQGLVTVICISISLFALSITFLFKLVGSKSMTFPVKIMLNVMMSLFMSQLFLLLMNIKHTAVCTAVAILSHYSWLSTFAWMLVSSIHMYKTFCIIPYSSRTNGYGYRRLLISLGAGYGGPLLIVVPTVCIHFCSCTELVVGYGVRGCFIAQPMANLLTFVAPVGLSILINFCLFIRTAVHIYRTSASAQCVQSDISLFRIFLKISSLSGFTWMFGYIAILTNNNVLWYIFTVLSSLQGVYIFIAFGLRDIKDACKNMAKYSVCINRDQTLTNSNSSETLTYVITKF